MAFALFYDGRTAQAHEATVSLDGDVLRIDLADHEAVWRLGDLAAEVEGDQARISNRRERDARLVLPRAEWAALIGDRLAGRRRARRRRELWLVGGLTATAAGVILFVTVGVPALSGPLARATPVGMEERMGSNFDAQVGALFPRCGGAEGQAVIEALGDRIAARADTSFDIRVRAVDAPMVNAFALPGGPVLITDDLIREARTPDELSAVIAHEISHVEKRHVMQAVWRNLGLGMLLDLIVGGGSGAGQQAVLLAGQASQLSYDRAAEREADARGQSLLHAEGLSSGGMATFFERLGEIDGSGGTPEAAEFLSTHPDSRRRARAARATEKPGLPALTASEWRLVKETCEAGSAGAIERLQRRLGLGDGAPGADQGDQVGPD